MPSCPLSRRAFSAATAKCVLPVPVSPTSSKPARDRPYAQYVTALIQRYGPKGTFWTANPTVPKDPITEWEIWNEEDLVGSWNTSPFASSYVGLLRVAYPAVKKAA